MAIRVENKIEMRKINEIKPYVRNPRKNDKTVELLMKLIPLVGFNVPIVIDKNGIIVKGHARFNAAIKLGMTELPCIVTHADEDAIKADRIADNKVSEFSEWMSEETLHEIDMINLDGFDFSELGFDLPSYDDIPSMEDFDIPEDEGENEISDEQRQKLYQEFLEKQAKENAVEVKMTTEKQLENARQAQQEIAAVPQTKYVKVVCEKCGHVMFADADNLWSPEGGLDRKSYFGK